MADGHLNKCKECAKKDTAKHREENIDAYRQYDRVRASRPHRVQQRKEYAKSSRGKAIMQKAKNDWGKRNKDKTSTQQKTRRMLIKGLLEKEKCCICGEGKTEAHHPDYSKPGAVLWLCDYHHKMIHKFERAIKRDERRRTKKTSKKSV